MSKALLEAELALAIGLRDAVKRYIKRGGKRQEWIDMLPDLEKAVIELETKQKQQNETESNASK